MKRHKNNSDVEVKSPRIKAFLADIFEVYRKHGLAISHQDSHGAFMIVKLDDYHVDWLNQASCDILDYAEPVTKPCEVNLANSLLRKARK